MKVQDLIFADHAAPNEAGKFTLVGAGFNEIFTRQLPLIQTRMFVLVRFRVTMADIGKNRIEFQRVGPLGLHYLLSFESRLLPHAAGTAALPPA